MKITAIILLSACLTASAKSNGQQVTLSVKDAPLSEVFQLIRKQTGYNFLYNDAWLNNAQKVSISVNKAPLTEALDLCFKGQPFSYTIIEKTIALKPAVPAPPAPITPTIPEVDIKGRITNENGEAVIATITVKGTKQGTTTDDLGYFSLKNVDESSTLLITAANIIPFEVKISTATNGNLGTLIAKMKIESLNEVIINKGYYTEKQKLSVSNVGTVKAKDIEKIPLNNPLLALQGRVPGLFITQSTGLPGSGVVVQIQGQTTVNVAVGNDPLYVIDGVPYGSRSLPTLSFIQGTSGDYAPTQAGRYSAGMGNPLSFINPSDIESIDVLKDADATAIYGSRAANGAILITTKRGKAGQTRVNLKLQNGWGKVSKKLDVMNTEQYLAMRREAITNDNITVIPTDRNYDLNGTWDQNRFTDWQETLIGGTAKYQDVQVSLSGGNANTQFLISPGYHKETTVFPGDLSNTTGSMHINLTNTSLNQKFQIQLSGLYSTNVNRLINTDLTGVAIKLPPNAPKIYNDDGSLNWAQLANGDATWTNPLAYLKQEYYNKTNSLTSNLILSYKLLTGLQIKSSFGYTNLQSDQYLLFPHSSILPQDRPSTNRSSSFGSGNINTWIIEPQITYHRSVSKGKLDALIGSSIQQNNSSQNVQDGSGYSSDLVIKDITAAPSKSANRGVSTYKYGGVFGRINYNWEDKYIININARRDGSSRFGTQNQFHNFGSFGASWIFSNENLFKGKSGFLSFGKLKGSYGTTGNDQIGDYQFLDLYTAINIGTGVPYQGATGFASNRLSNPYLAWEETRKLQIGMDLGFFKDRILLNVEYIRNRSSNQLLRYSLPIVTGFTGIIENFPALVQNSGWEISLATQIISRKDFKWSNNFNITIPKNKLLEFPNLALSSVANDLVVGQPITITKALNFAGVNSTTGLYQFIDKNGNLTSSPDFTNDRTIIINNSPKFYGGFENSFVLKNFEIDLLFQFVKQIGRNYSFGTLFPGAFSGTANTGNQPTSILDHWGKTGDNSSFQKFATFSNSSVRSAYSNAIASNGTFSDASFIRLKNTSISWQLPSKWKTSMKLQQAKIFLNAQNLFTITKFKGLDPETRSSITLPPLRIISLGAQLSF